MEFRKKIAQNLIALLLGLVLLTPVAVQFSHLFGNHKHTSCSKTKKDKKQDSDDCEICSFTYDSFNNNFITYPAFKEFNTPVKKPFFYKELIISSYSRTNTQLRAPPVLFS